MHLCRRGDIGFPEAVIGAAAVCVVLSSFVLMAYGTVGQEDPSVSPDWSFLRGAYIDHGAIVIDEEPLESFSYTAGINGLSVETDAHGVVGIDDCNWSYGEQSGNRSVSVKVKDLESDDGRTIPVTFRVNIWS